MKKLVSLLVLAMVTATSSVHAEETYTVRGAIIGGSALGVLTGLVGFGIGSSTGEDGQLDPSNSDKIKGTLIGTGVGLVIGAGIGAGIGAMIPKESKVSISPTFDPTPGATGGGVNLLFNF